MPSIKLVLSRLYNRVASFVYSFDAIRGEGTPGVNLKKIPFSKSASRNYIALSNRPFMEKGYKFRDIKPQHKIFVEYRQNFIYSGLVNIQVYGLEPLIVYADNDDSVAFTYFHFGPDSYETLSVALFGFFARQSRTVLDVGAYTGLYALVAARANPQAEIHAFEPVELLAERAQFNASINGFEKICVHSYAISDREKTADLIIYGRSEASTGASFHKKKNPNVLKTIQVPVKSLDGVFPDVDSIDLVKIDTEFDEHNALVGAKGIIEKSRPVIFAEVLDNESMLGLADFLQPHGYHGVYLSETTIELVALEAQAGKSPIDRYGYGNVAFFPDQEHLRDAGGFAKKLRNALPD